MTLKIWTPLDNSGPAGSAAAATGGGVVLALLPRVGRDVVLEEAGVAALDRRRPRLLRTAKVQEMSFIIINNHEKKINKFCLDINQAIHFNCSNQITNLS